MSKRKHKNVLIEKFLREELTEEELVDFRKYWDNDPGFVKEVQDYSRLRVALKAANRLEENKKMKRTGVISHVRKAFFRYQPVAAILLLAIMLPLYLLLQGQKIVITSKSPEVRQLAKTYFINDRLVNGPEGADDNLSEVMSAYHNRQISRAVALMNKTVASTDPYYLFVKADLYFEIDLQDSATYYYSIGLKDDQNDALAYWNNLMSKLWLGDLTLVKSELRRLSKSEKEPYRDHAIHLLMELE